MSRSLTPYEAGGVDHNGRPRTFQRVECFSGFNAFVGGGSFEVFYQDAKYGRTIPAGGNPTHLGWYWWSCWPGCLPDGDPSGPFPTAEGAYLDAIGE